MSSSNLTVEAWPATDPGQASKNEDYVLVYHPQDRDVARFSGSLYIIADGTGGGDRGQIASRYTAQKIMQAYYDSDEPDLGLRLKQAIEQANADLHAYGRTRAELVKMGASLVAMVVRGEQAHVASVGAARAYLVRDGEIYQITRDHTLVQQLIEEGAITPEEAATHPRKEVVLRSVGSEAGVVVDVYDLRIRADDSLVVCSDGLTSVVNNEEIAGVVAGSSPRAATETLLERAFARGSKDNVSAVTVLVRAGAPSLEDTLPHSWDGGPATFDAQPTLAKPRTERPAKAEQKPVPEPDAGETVKAPAYKQDVVPAPDYETPKAKSAPAAGRKVSPPKTGLVDPETGLSPYPDDELELPGKPEGWTGPQPAYTPRVYKPAQPKGLREPRRGVSVGAFAAVGVIAVLLTLVMVVLLVNPFNWELPFSGDSGETADTQPTDNPTPQPTNQVSETQEPTEEVTEEPQPTLMPTPTTAPIPDVVPPANTVLISAGPYLRGVTDDEVDTAVQTCIQTSEDESPCFREWFTDAQPVEEVTLSAFYIDITEVTNAAYRECVDAGVCDLPDDTQFYDDADNAYDLHPVVFVSYDQAITYCVWRDMRLPTEAEWEVAARWDPVTVATMFYPWGDDFENGIANTLGANLAGTNAVLAFQRDLSPLGAVGMGGNVSEWVQDWYFDSYAGLGTTDPVRLGTQPLPDPYRVVRGGNFTSPPHFVRSGHRLDVPPASQVEWLGFRCASSVEEWENLSTIEEPATAEPTVEVTPTP